MNREIISIPELVQFISIIKTFQRIYYPTHIPYQNLDPDPRIHISSRPLTQKKLPLDLQCTIKRCIFYLNVLSAVAAEIFDVIALRGKLHILSFLE